MAKGYVFALTVCFMGCAPSSSPLAVGAEIPAEWTSDAYDSAGALTVWWVVTTGDCLNCVKIQPMLRRLHYERGGSPILKVLHIGRPEDQPIVERFLSTERLPVPVIRVSPKAHLESNARDWPTPLLILARGREAIWILTPGVPPEIPLEEVLDSVSRLSGLSADTELLSSTQKEVFE